MSLRALSLRSVGSPVRTAKLHQLVPCVPGIGFLTMAILSDAAAAWLDCSQAPRSAPASFPSAQELVWPHSASAGSLRDGPAGEDPPARLPHGTRQSSEASAFRGAGANAHRCAQNRHAARSLDAASVLLRCVALR